MIATAEAINEAFDLALASRYAMTSMGHNDTSSRPPKDLGGASAVCATLAKGGTSGAMMLEPPAA